MIIKEKTRKKEATVLTEHYALILINVVIVYFRREDHLR